jgi:hypothetical protein
MASGAEGEIAALYVSVSARAQALNDSIPNMVKEFAAKLQSQLNNQLKDLTLSLPTINTDTGNVSAFAASLKTAFDQLKVITDLPGIVHFARNLRDASGVIKDINFNNGTALESWAVNLKNSFAHLQNLGSVGAIDFSQITAFVTELEGTAVRLTGTSINFASSLNSLTEGLLAFSAGSLGSAVASVKDTGSGLKAFADDVSYAYNKLKGFRAEFKGVILFAEVLETASLLLAGVSTVDGLRRFVNGLVYAYEQLKEFRAEFKGVIVLAEVLETTALLLEGVSAVIGLRQFVNSIVYAYEQLKDVKGQFKGVIALTDAIVNANQNLSGITTPTGLRAFANAIQQFASISPTAGTDLRKFADDVAYAYDQMKGMKAQFAGALLFADVVNKMAALMQGVSSVTRLRQFAFDVQYAYGILSKITGFASAGVLGFAQVVQQINGLLNGLSTLSNVRSMANNIKAAMNALSQIGTMPHLPVMAQNAIQATTALTNLNVQIEKHINLLQRLASTIRNVPTTPIPTRTLGAPSGGTGGFGGSSGSIGGFNPFRRMLSTMTGIGTGMLAGFLGFQMEHEIAGFDNEMNRATSLLQLHMRQAGRNLPEGMSFGGVRRTAENDILALSRNVTTSPRELAAAFAELVKQFNGTESALKSLAVVEQFAFVNTMDVAKAAQHLSTMQRQLGLTSENAVTNAKNMREMADAITSGLQLSGMSAENFMKGLERLTPHLRLMNRDLGEGVALLTAFGRATPGRAVENAEALLRGLDQALVRASVPSNVLHQGLVGREPAGAVTRRTLGAGILPGHGMTGNPRIPSQAMQNLGISTDMIGNVPAMLTAMDRAMQSMTPLMRQTHIDMLGLPRAAREALEAILADGDALKAMAMAARDANGVMQDIANIRLQTFDSQIEILRNNLFSIGIEMGRVLVPVLQVVNTLVRDGFNWWFSLDDAVRRGVVGVSMMAGSLVALRFLFPILSQLGRFLFRDTLVGGIGMVRSALSLLWSPFSMLMNGFQSFLAFIPNAVDSMKLVWKALTFIPNAIDSIKFGILVAWYVLLGIVEAPVVILTGALDIAMGGLAAACNFVILGLSGVLLSLMALNFLIPVVLGVVSALVSSLLSLASFTVIAGIGLLTSALRGVGEWVTGINWLNSWSTFTQGIKDAFWWTVGFFDNFKHNFTVIMSMMKREWPTLITWMGDFMQIVFRNLFINLQSSFTALFHNLRIKLELQKDLFGLRFSNDTLENKQAQAKILRDAAAADMISLMAWNPLLMGVPGMPSMGRGLFRGRDQIPGLRTEVSRETEQRVGSLLRQMNPFQQRGAEAEGDRIGQRFTEISLHRFVLGNAGGEATIESQQLDVLRRIEENTRPAAGDDDDFPNNEGNPLVDW